MTYGTPAWREWVLDEETSRPFIRQALEAGINFFDTADMYSLGASEEVVGRAFRDFAKREDLVIATKVYNAMGPGPNDRGLSRKHILRSCDDSLRRLGTDYIDLYQTHRWDYETPIEETMDALDSLVKAGKVRYLGASSMFAWQFMKSLSTSDVRGLSRFVSMQPQYNLVYREEEREMLPLCADQGIAVIPWSPLARGFVTRRPGASTVRAETDAFSKVLYTSEVDAEIANKVCDIAESRGIPPAQVALAWVLSKPVVTAPIVGASKTRHLDDALAALAVKLTDDEIRSLEEPYVPHLVKDHD
ncbi:putative oxidoreductase [Fimbriimonas ginsengisoli Gsoil 348]|uniref:Putative oxidoreductase n=2 Tax=Fimbriimonas ginsengisoli TaxID=1005039 RepID=A0A068NIU5_FIMGI|nr:putative oxidoreductase [Fimbriimonas ginsengisoli Gsoil 348]